MARPFTEAGPDRLVIQEGGGALSILGLPFLCAGVFMWLGVLGIVPIANASRASAYTWPLLALMALLFTAVGAALVFGRAWTTVDATRREVVNEWGLLAPMRRTVHPVDSGATLSLGFDLGDADSASRFPLVLRSPSGQTTKLGSFTDYADARACASAVARHLRLEIEDATTDHTRRIPASQADLSIRERSRVDRQRPDAAERPAAQRSTVTDENGRIRILIPNERLHPILLALMLVPAAMPLAVLGPLGGLLRLMKAPDPVGRIFLGLLFFGFVVLPATAALTGWLRSRVGCTIVTASSEGLEVERRGVWRTTQRQAIAAADILDLDFSTRESAVATAKVAVALQLRQSGSATTGTPAVGPRTERIVAALGRLAKGRGVIVKTRQGLITFGNGLADEEVRYLQGVIRRALLR